jgi:hypothetical protein
MIESTAWLMSAISPKKYTTAWATADFVTVPPAVTELRTFLKLSEAVFSHFHRIYLRRYFQNFGGNGSFFINALTRPALRSLLIFKPGR